MTTAQAGADPQSAIAYISTAVDDADSVALGPEDAPVARPLGHGLLTTYVVEEEEELRYLQGRHLAGWDTEVLHQRAIANLAHRARGQLEVQEYGSIYAVLLDGMFEASLLLLDPFWDEGVDHLVPNGAVAAIPARDVLAFCDGASETGLRELQQLVERVWPGGDHLLTPMLFKRTDGSWHPFRMA